MIKAIIDKTQFVLTAIKNCFLTCRKTWAVIISAASAFVAWCFFDNYLSLFGGDAAADSSMGDGTKGSVSSSAHASIISSIFLILLALPISFYFWVLRNHDKLKQIEQAEASNNHSSLSNAMRLFLEKDNKKANAVGLKLLMKLRHVKQLKEQIDIATPNADLSGLDLSKSNLSGANLESANLVHANLFDADLSGAVLKGADLSWANLYNANFEGVNLTGVFLTVPVDDSYSVFASRDELEEFLKNKAPRKKSDTGKYLRVVIIEHENEEWWGFHSVRTE